MEIDLKKKSIKIEMLIVNLIGLLTDKNTKEMWRDIHLKYDHNLTLQAVSCFVTMKKRNENS